MHERMSQGKGSEVHKRKEESERMVNLQRLQSKQDESAEGEEIN